MKQVLGKKLQHIKQGKQKAQETHEVVLLEEQDSKLETNSRGSAIVDKVNKMLDALLKAFGSRITLKIPSPAKLQEYPYPLQEKINLVQNQVLIHETQTLLEGPPSRHRF